MLQVVVLLLVWALGALALGWPLARAAFPHEQRLALLTGGALLSGYCLNTLLLVLLWGVMLPGQAYMLVVPGSIAVGAGYLWMHRKRRAHIYIWGMSHADTAALVALITVFAFLAHRFFTIGFSSWDSEALYWHSGVTGWISRSTFPPANILEPDDPLHYRFGLYVLGSAIVGLTGESPPSITAWSLAGLMPLMVVALACASLRLFGSARPGLIASVLGLFGGSLLPLFRIGQAVFGEANPESRPLEYVSGLLWLGNNLDMLHNNITISGGFVAFTIALWLYWEAIGRGRVVWGALPLAWASLAFLGLANEVHFGALLGGVGAMIGLAAMRGLKTADNGGWRILLASAGLVASSLAVVLLRGGFLGGAALTGAATGSVRLTLNTEHPGQLPAPPGIWDPPFISFLKADVQIDTVLVIIGLPVLFLLAWRSRNGYAIAGLASSAAALVAWFTVYPALAPYDGFRFGQAGLSIYLTLAPFALRGYPGTRLSRNKALRLTAVVAASALVSVHLVLAAWVMISPPVASACVPGSPDLQAAQWLRASESTRHVLVVLPPDDTGLGEVYRADPFGAALRTILGESSHAVPMGHNSYDNPEEYVRLYRLAGTTFHPEPLQALRVDWVYVLPAYLSTQQKSGLERAETAGVIALNKVFGVAGTDSERLLFRVVRAAPTIIEGSVR